MTCKYGKYKNGKPVCGKEYPMQLSKCMKGGLPCYKERKKVDKQ